MAGSFAEQNKAATCRAAPTAGADGDLDPALLSTICDLGYRRPFGV
jgi:hypothetical protein